MIKIIYQKRIYIYKVMFREKKLPDLETFPPFFIKGQSKKNVRKKNPGTGGFFSRTKYNRYSAKNISTKRNTIQSDVYI